MTLLDVESPESAPARDTVESLFQPDTIAPAEYFDGRRKSAAEPEKELVLALIEDAASCFKKYLGSKREKEQRLFADAEEWFFSDDREWPLSFLNVCDLLGLEPGYLRKGLAQWKLKALSAGLSARASKQITETKKRGENYGREAKRGRKEARHADKRSRVRFPLNWLTP